VIGFDLEGGMQSVQSITYRFGSGKVKNQALENLRFLMWNQELSGLSEIEF
jgi:hypothetical protein